MPRRLFRNRFLQTIAREAQQRVNDSSPLSLGDPAARFGKLTHQPIGLDRIAEPRFGPAMRNAGANQSGIYVLALLVEQGKLTTRLAKTSNKITALRSVGLRWRFLATYRPDRDIAIGEKWPVLRPAHVPPFLLPKEIELLFNAVERKMFAASQRLSVRRRPVPRFRPVKSQPKTHRIKAWRV